jgi:hypothetical protein
MAGLLDSGPDASGGPSPDDISSLIAMLNSEGAGADGPAPAGNGSVGTPGALASAVQADSLPALPNVPGGTDSLGAPAVGGSAAVPGGGDSMGAPSDLSSLAGGGLGTAPVSPSLGSKIDDFTGLLGKALGAGGDSGIPLSPAAEKAADTRALMQFGTAMMAGAGPSLQRHSFGQILAAGLDAAGQARGQAESTAAAQAQLAQKNAMQMQLLQLQGQDRNLKQQQYLLDLAKFNLVKSRSDAVARLGGADLFGGGPAAAAAKAALNPPAPGFDESALPQPDARATMSAFKDPALADQITSASAQVTNIDPQYQAMLPKVALAIANQESGGDPNAPMGTDKKSYGPFQIGSDEGGSVGVGDVTTLDGNVTAGTRYIGQLLQKYGGDVGKVALAYNAGQQKADDVIAGKAAIPDTTRQYLANIHAMLAPPAAAAAAPSAAPAPAFDRNTGLWNRGSATLPPGGPAPGAAPGAAPGPPAAAAAADLPPDVQAVFRSRIAAAKAAADPVAAYQEVMKDLASTVQSYHDNRITQLTPEQAAAKLQGGYQPTGVYGIDGTGKVVVMVPPMAPVPFNQTPADKQADMFRAIDKAKLDGYAAASKTATDLRPQFDFLSQLNTTMGNGVSPLSRWPDLGDAAVKLGVGTPAEIATKTAQDAFEGLVSKIAPEMRPSGTGRFSNQEMEAYLKSLPQLGSTQYGRQLQIGILNALSQRKIAENNFAQDYVRGNGERGTAGLDTAMEAALGPVLQREPPKGADPQDVATFASRLMPGQPYVKANGRTGLWGVPKPEGQP